MLNHITGIQITMKDGWICTITKSDKFFDVQWYNNNTPQENLSLSKEELIEWLRNMVGEESWK